MKTRRLTAAVLVTSLMFTCAAAHAEVSVGDEAPDFKLVGSDGKTYTNADFKGKKAVVIAWYPKAFTGG
jgi:peroxiredoxin Q/BCP